jgi:hypothetical protein
MSVIIVIRIQEIKNYFKIIFMKKAPCYTHMAMHAQMYIIMNQNLDAQ